MPYSAFLLDAVDACFDHIAADLEPLLPKAPADRRTYAANYLADFLHGGLSPIALEEWKALPRTEKTDLLQKVVRNYF